MVHAMIWLPIKMFTTSVMEGAIECWCWAIIGRPELELLVKDWRYDFSHNQFYICFFRLLRKFIKHGKKLLAIGKVSMQLINLNHHHLHLQKNKN